LILNILDKTGGVLPPAETLSLCRSLPLRGGGAWLKPYGYRQAAKLQLNTETQAFP